ncbi:gamma-glutamyltransferase [Thecamonas trahens ATCC 50062]|uniref:Gamma-glutamyltransferase n=1 Tax=Thecamonas trahens ATCC 50062 TaxID=461836 RepID=A0A0L0D252_THETB|nr:gamma-glutamyltransferase [Thecamonas trahens ATCC 50062]KNC46429.1 gamma-glutamyltransferase [Thecamonas trahens ATCC 50062]|eukprot:XP_013760720.1 gamma-glutamyltransferase [Thecamonas trahens ATCC 50062]
MRVAVVSLGLLLTVSLVTVIAVVSAHDAAAAAGGASPASSRIRQAESKLGMVAADQPTCSQMGAAVLDDGGSAADAAVTTALCLGAINAFASGIGGGGFATVRTANGSAEVFDFRETAPAKAFRDMFDSSAEKAQVGGLAVAVPGELRGLELMWQRHGRLPWARLIEPVVALCNDGFEVTDELAKIVEYTQEYIKASPAFAAVYMIDGQLVKAGQTIRRPKLAATLEAVAAGGANAFYTGAIAHALIDAIQGSGGIMELGDLANYTAVIREPVSTYFLGMKVLSAPPPSSGAILNFMLNVLEEYNLPKIGAMTHDVVHKVVEAMKFAFALRTHLGDPCCTDIEQVMADLTSKDYAAWVRTRIVPDATFNASYYGAAFDMEPTPGTTHFSVVDSERNAVALTSTVNLFFGSKVMDPVTGVVLNNEMDDFSVPNVTNAFGVKPSPANYIVPGKRPLSSTTPTIVTANDQVLAVAGASGGTKITTSTLLTLLKMFAWGMEAGEAVASPRFHDQLYPNVLQVEYGFAQSLVTYLRESIGYELDELGPDGHIAIVQAIYNDIDKGILYGASDWRKGGAPAGQVRTGR